MLARAVVSSAHVLQKSAANVPRTACVNESPNRLMKIDWIRKLTSRKLWIAAVGLVSGLKIAFDGSAETAETVTGCIMSAASVVAYVIGEGLTDAAHTEQPKSDE